MCLSSMATGRWRLPLPPMWRPGALRLMPPSIPRYTTCCGRRRLPQATCRAEEEGFRGRTQEQPGLSASGGAGDALAALIRRSKGRDNKTLAAFAESLRTLLEKFKF